MSIIDNPIFESPKEGLAQYKIQQEFVGTSGDSKPTGVEKYSMFLELDTGDFYYFTGSVWSKVGG